MRVSNNLYRAMCMARRRDHNNYKSQKNNVTVDSSDSGLVLFIIVFILIIILANL